MIGRSNCLANQPLFSSYRRRLFFRLDSHLGSKSVDGPCILMEGVKADLHGTIFVTIVTKIRDDTCAVTKSVFF